MPASMACFTGVVNDVALITAVAMPAALAAVAVEIAAVISEVIEFCDPVHLGAGRPRSAAASFIPNWVGTKKRLVVTWLTNQNCHAGVFGKFPIALLAAALDLPLDEQAASSAAAAADALTSPVPSSSLRRVTPSLMFSVSIASSTLGSMFLIYLPPEEVPQCSARHHSAARRKADGLPSPWDGHAEPAVSQASKRSQTPERGKAPDCPALQGSPRKVRSPSEPPTLAASLVLDSTSVFQGRALCGVPAARPTHGYPDGAPCPPDALSDRTHDRSGTPLWSLKLNHTESIVNEQDIKIRFRRDHGAADMSRGHSPRQRKAQGCLPDTGSL